MFGFIKNKEEPSIYMKLSDGRVVFLILYVNDILKIGNKIKFLSTKFFLKNMFPIKV